ncbi:MAG: 3-isopropylmalate dehydratase large subunit [Candidatus Bathyarchaeota archaeon]|nr:MAG: 3-isopropylmalate dehydratase large subunit [Candidatus Bathyarchaeota archaeon]
MGLTITERILANASHKSEVTSGDVVIADVDIVMAHDSTAPLAIEGLYRIGKKVFDPKKIVIIFDHFFPPPSVNAARLHQKVRNFVTEQKISNFLTNGVCHQILVEEFVSPGNVVVGADSHTCTEGAVGAFSTGLGSTDIAGAMATGKCWFKIPDSLRFNLSGLPGKGVYAKDVILNIVGDVGADGALYKAVEFTGDYVENTSVSSRLTLCNMAVEMGAKNGVIEADEKTRKFLGREGKIFKSDKDAVYEDEYEIEVGRIEPQVACPPTVDNVKPVTSVEGKKVDQAYIGTCTNGRLEDIEIAAKILKGKRIASNVRLLVIPASTKIYFDAFNKGYLQETIKSGGIICNPGCGPCVGRHEGVLAEGETCISTQNRNFSGRMGHPKAEIYLASSATVAASALAGEIVDPRGYI